MGVVSDMIAKKELKRQIEERQPQGLPGLEDPRGLATSLARRGQLGTGRELPTEGAPPGDLGIAGRAFAQAGEAVIPTVIGLGTGNLPLLGRAALQGAAQLGLGQMVGLAKGESVEESLVGAAPEAGIATISEILTPAAAKFVLGPATGLVRKTGQAVREGIRATRGGAPPVELPGLRGQVVEGGEQAFESAREVGGLLTPGQVSTEPWIDLMENLTTGSLLGGRRVARVRQQTGNLLEDAINQTIDQFPDQTREQVFRMIDSAVDNRLMLTKGFARGKYRAADKLLVGLDGEPVPIVDISSAKKIIAAEADKARFRASSPTKINEMNQRLNELPDRLTFEQAQTLRSDLFAISGQLNPTADPILDAERGIAKKLAGVVSERISSGAKQANPDAARLIKEANDLWRQEIRGEVGSKFMKQLLSRKNDLRGGAEDVLDAILSEGSPGKIRVLRKVVESEIRGNRLPRNSWEQVQGAFLRRIASQSGDALEKGGRTITRIDGQKLLNNIANMERVDGASIQAMFPDKKAVDRIKRLGSALSIAQRKAEGTQVGGMWIGIGQVAAAGALGALLLGFGDATPASVGTAAGIVLTPAAIGRLLTNPDAAAAMTVAAGAKRGSKALARAGLVILGNVIEDLPDSEREKAISMIRGFQDDLGIEESKIEVR